MGIQCTTLCLYIYRTRQIRPAQIKPLIRALGVVDRDQWVVVFRGRVRLVSVWGAVLVDQGRRGVRLVVGDMEVLVGDAGLVAVEGMEGEEGVEGVVVVEEIEDDVSPPDLNSYILSVLLSIVSARSHQSALAVKHDRIIDTRLERHSTSTPFILISRLSKTSPVEQRPEPSVSP